MRGMRLSPTRSQVSRQRTSICSSVSCTRTRETRLLQNLLNVAHTCSTKLRAQLYGGVKMSWRSCAAAKSLTLLDLWAEWPSRTTASLRAGRPLARISSWRKCLVFYWLVLLVTPYSHLTVSMSPPTAPYTVRLLPRRLYNGKRTVLSVQVLRFSGVHKLQEVSSNQ